ncbi:response regulator [Aquabacterium sp.]|uniref:response regulator n=1 Tax=Aquabacterium sp. TaxID=1872578 RepID=UPI002B6A486F|nr:response regulator [Aquabacterium sp.]HSW08962.1 response regulator [Aquabacterium sp.]
MNLSFLRTVTGKTLLRLALAGAAVLLLASLLGTWLLFRQVEATETQHLIALVSERARVAERVLRHTAETHEAVRQAFAQKWPSYQNAAAGRRFDTLMARYPDGAWRNRREIADGRLYPTGWVHRNSPLSDDLRRRMVLFYDLSQTYGPGAALRRDNLFFVGLPDESNMGYDPVLYPNWIFDIGESFSHLDFEWGRIAYAPAAPGAATRWATPLVDAEVPTGAGPVFTALTPIHIGQRHLATVGSTMLLNDFLGRVMPGTAPGSVSHGRTLIFAAGGTLIADTAMGERLSPQVGKFMLAQLDSPLAAALQAARREADRAPQAGYNQASDTYFGLARIEGPDWYVAATLPGALLRQRALGPALWALGAGFGVLLSLLLIFALVLRRQVAAPLGALTRAAESLATGDTSVRLPSRRDDELGRLAHAFNDMTEKVAQRDAALREDKDRIEAALTSLRLNEERWRAMTDNASDVIAVIDEAACFSYVSPSVEKMLGSDAASLIGHSAFDRMHPDDVPQLRARLLQPSGKATLVRAHHANGQWRTLEMVDTDLRQHPAVAGLVLNIRDISETVQAEEALAQQREALHQSEKLSALGGLLAGVAHELNNPLAVVVGRAIQLQSAAASAADRDTASKIRQAAERCARIVKTFLAMARKQEAERRPTDINGVIADAIDVLAYTLQSGGVQVQTRLASGLPPVLADADQLAQVFLNLFSNAQQAMATGTGPRQLTVCTRAVPGEAMLTVEVSDSGPGVPPELAGRIFEPFFTTKPVGAGTGVGLSVSLGIVQAHGGTLRLDTSPRSGATFVLSLPTLHHAAPTPPAVAAERPARSRPLQILVVDDEVEIAEILREILAEHGHHVTLAHGGEEALQRLSEAAFDLVLSDLKMPGMDGPALYRQIQQRYPQLARRVIAVTGDTLGSSAHDFVQTSGVPVIDKPFDPDEIVACVHALMAQAERADAE